MKRSLIDTDILSMLFRDNREVKKNFAEYLSKYNKINISIVSYYEIISGLKHKDAQRQMDSFIAFASQNNIIPLTTESVTLSAEIYSILRKKGTPVDDIDLLIAGTALENGLIVVTNNTKHFGKIERLTVENWSVN